MANLRQHPVHNHLQGTEFGRFLFKIYALEKAKYNDGKEQPVNSVPGKIAGLRGASYQNDYLFEALHLFSLQNRIKLTANDVRIAVITLGVPFLNHTSLRELEIETKSYDKKTRITVPNTAICALLSSSRLENNFIGILPASKLSVYDIQPHVVGLIMGLGDAVEKKPDAILIVPYWEDQNDAVDAAINATIQENIPVICPAGEGDNTLDTYPSSSPDVISVASIGINDKKSQFSNYGKAIDICAYGEDVISASYVKSTSKVRDSWSRFSGNIYSACFVAATCGIIHKMNKKVTSKQIENVLKETADKIDYANVGLSEQLGSGKLNAFGAISKIRNM